MEVERLSGVVQKGWGYELIWATNNKYCGKIMVFEKIGNKFSMHFHREKDETWFASGYPDGGRPKYYEHAKAKAFISDLPHERR